MSWFSSLRILNPWGAVAFSGLGVIIIIYLFKRKYREVNITALFLWAEHKRTRRGGRTREKLQFSRSLLLDLLAFFLLAAAFCLPAVISTGGKSEVLILDNSFSMRADSNYKKVQNNALKLINEMKNDSTVTVILAGRQPEIICGPEATKSEAIESIRSYNPFAPENPSLSKAVNLAEELMPGSFTLHIFTDSKEKISLQSDEVFFLHRYSCNTNNIAIVDALRSISEKFATGSSVVVTAANFGSKEATVKLSVRLVDDKKEPVFQKSFRLPAEQKKTLELEIPDSILNNIFITLSSDDDSIAEDSKAVLAPQPEKILSFATALGEKENRPFNLALQAAGAVYASGIAEADLIVTYNDLKPQPETFFLQIIKGKRKAVPTVGPFTILLDSPLCRDIDLSGAYWGFHKNIKLTGAIIPLITAGNIPLYWKKGENSYAMNFSAPSSNLQLLPCWPALLKNLAEECRGKLKGLHKANYRGGEEIKYNLPGKAKGDFTLIEKNNNSSRYKSEITPLKPGIYLIDNNSEKTEQIAVNLLSASESNLSTTAEKTENLQIIKGSKGILPKTLSKITLPLLLAALALLFLNWYLDWRYSDAVHDKNEVTT